MSGSVQSGKKDLKDYSYYQTTCKCLNFTGLDMLHDNSITAAVHDSYETESYKSSYLKGTRI